MPLTFSPRLALGALILPLAVASALAQPVLAQPLELPGAQFNLPPLTVPELPSAPAPQEAPEAAPRDAPILRGAAETPSPADITQLTLRRDGRDGALSLVSANGGYRATLTLEGRGIATPDEACAVTIAADDGAAEVALEPVPSLGRYARMRFAAPACPVVVTLFPDAALVSHEGFCTFEAADCRVDANGMWGPEPEALPTDPERLARERVEAEEDVRAAFRIMAERSDGDALRAALAEQAGFSAERTTACARFAGEEAHGLCAARWTQARAASLQQRLAYLPPPPQQTPATAADPGAAPMSILPQDN